MGEFFKDYGGHVIGAIALVQVWAIAAWRRFIQKPILTFHPSGQIQLGFGELGPSISLLGTLRCKGKAVFLERIVCRVTRGKDRASHTFNWETLRNASTDGGSRDRETATGFLLQPTAPASRQVVFTVGSIRRDNLESATAVQREWFSFTDRRMRENMPDSDHSQLGKLLEHPDVKAGLFEEFVRTDAAVTFHRKLNNECFWHAGTIRLELEGTAVEMPPVRLGTWTVNITSEDEGRLRGNVIAALRSACGLPAAYSSVFRDYAEVEEAPNAAS